VPTQPDIEIRRASSAECEQAALLLIRSRHANVPAIPPLSHADEEVRRWFVEVVAPNQHVWVAVLDDLIVGTLVLSTGWIEQLYVDPGWTGRGIGEALLEQAKLECPGGLDLWTFVSNVGAQRFYERHEFVAVARSDGDNEEGAPDIKYRWRQPD